MKFSKKNKNTLIFIISLILLFGAIVAVFVATKNDDKKNTLSSNIFSVGALSSNGAYRADSACLYTKDAIECQGLDVKIAFDSNIKYQIYFYDSNSIFLSSTPILTDKYSGSPVMAKFCRIVIMPIDDDKVNFWEIRGYANQLTIKVDKVQKCLYENNLYDVDDTKTGKNFSDVSINSYVDVTDGTCSKTIDVSPYSQLRIVRKDLNANKNIKVFLANESGVILSVNEVVIDNVTNSGSYVETIIDVPVACRTVGVSGILGSEILVFGC